MRDMKKSDAQKMSREGKISIGELRAIITKRKPQGGFSVVNKAVTIDQACGIYEQALGNRKDDEIPEGMKWGYGRGLQSVEKPTRDSLIICNILRDCA